MQQKQQYTSPQTTQHPLHSEPASREEHVLCGVPKCPKEVYIDRFCIQEYFPKLQLFK